MMRPLRLAALTALVVLPLVACRREEPIETYRVPKEPGAVAAADPHAGMAMTGADGSDPHGGMLMPGGGSGDPHAAFPTGAAAVPSRVSGEVPDHWQPGPGSSMRLASYRVTGVEDAEADISLSVLAGDAGGVAGNVNRWRGQVGLAPSDDIDADKLDSPQGEALVIDLDGSAAGSGSARDGRILAAIVPREEETWFFKMRGNPALVGQEKDAFMRWVETAEPTTEAGAPPEAEAAGPPDGVEWRVPAGWRAMPGDSLRLAVFASAAGAEATVVRLGGAAGGELANVNRWRGQVGLEPVDSLGGMIEPLKGGEVSMVDLVGPERRTLAAWSRSGGATWFFKLTGESQAVEEEREAFVDFVESVRFARE